MTAIRSASATDAEDMVEVQNVNPNFRCQPL